jgi:hypothetical protein
MTARLRDVDPSGTYGLVSHFVHPLRLVDLRASCWVPNVTFPRHLWFASRRCAPRLTSDGRLVHAELELVGYRETQSHFLGIRTRSWRDDSTHLFSNVQPTHGSFVSAVADRYSCITDSQHVVVIDGQNLASFEPLPYKVVQAAAIDGAHDLLAAATWGELVLGTISNDRFTRAAHAKLDPPGDATWVAIAASRVAVAIDARRIEVRRIADDLSIGDAFYLRRFSEITDASLSRDGRFLAVATPDALVVCDLDTREETIFDDHTDRVHFVRFAGDDQLLVSADTDNRVIVRPRDARGYRSPSIPIELE